MIFYWETEDYQNIVEGSSIFNADPNRTELLRHSIQDNVTDVVSTIYPQPGIVYFQLMGILNVLVNHDDDPDNLMIGNLITDHVAKGLRDNKIIVVIDNSLEAHEFYDYDIELLHAYLRNNHIPSNRIVIISGAWQAEDSYIKQCKKLNQDPMLNFCSWNTLPSLSIEGNAMHDENYYPVLTAIKDPDSKDFLSLNQTVKRHRTEHVYRAVRKGYHDKGLINASFTRFGEVHHGAHIEYVENKCLYNTENFEWELLVELHRIYPLIADKDLTMTSPDDLSGSLGMYSQELYEKSLLSFVTESEYDQDCVFLTEKSFKVMLAGHPFIILGNAGTIKHLSRMGFRTDICDINHDYDSELDHVERFKKCHDELERWINITREEKIRLIIRDMHKIRYNRRLCEKLFLLKRSQDVIDMPPGQSETLLHRETQNIVLYLESKLEDLYNEE